MHIDLDQHTFALHRPSDLESMWEQMADEDLTGDERIPYWVELWPASIVLGKWLFKNRHALAHNLCMDLGCGLGLCTQVAAACGARVIGVDYEAQALACAKLSAPGHPLISWLGMDWRKPCLQPGSVPLIFGADILYESRFFPPLHALWQHLLPPGGRIWVTAPDRQVTRPFLHSTLPSAGWRVRCLAKEKVPLPESQGVEIMLWEIAPSS